MNINKSTKYQNLGDVVNNLRMNYLDENYIKYSRDRIGLVSSILNSYRNEIDEIYTSRENIKFRFAELVNLRLSIEGNDFLSIPIYSGWRSLLLSDINRKINSLYDLIEIKSSSKSEFLKEDKKFLQER